MATIKRHFYVAKGKNDISPWLFYGENPPIIMEDGECTEGSKCVMVGQFMNNPIADSIQDNEIVKIYIRKETKKNK